ncbi:hypothetical protein BWZ20_09115 [Winogradskyella sp. J14-2]|uniref:hypothetical protein n=1 Tax=Winogradskyella sp. J14-2 TaxID=1936080 RepID=UPI0009727B6B|nr:hypothetical protein [Winogradskyella sp. J14-2]APY08445.1 hypothetical protein BWZ20_09115 [Winogradskyella sp. J14-2]
MKIEELGLIITVIIFGLSVAFNNYQMYHDRKKSWYIEIIVNSNLEKIEKFFKSIFNEFKESRKQLLSDYKEITKEYLENKAKKEKSLHKLKNSFHFEILPLFKSYDINLAKKLEDELMKFQDVYTENIGIENKSDTEKIIRELRESKRSFYDTLYSPIKSSFFQKLQADKILLYLLIILFILLMIKILRN